MTSSYRVLRKVGIVFALLLILVVSVPGISHADSQRDLRVMTQNLYIGSGFGPALAADTQAGFFEGVATIYATIQYTDFPTRAEFIADEIATNHPDIIGLQEVLKVTAVDQDQKSSTLDYLDVLLNALKKRKLSYKVAAISHNVKLGPIPLVQPCAGEFGACNIWFEDRDIILVDNTAPLKIVNSQSGTYLSQHIFLTATGQITLDRGWVYIDGEFQGKGLRFVNTHLDEEFYPEQETQAAEFLAGPAKTQGTVIAVGDFNSAANGSTTASYGLLTESYFEDAWNSKKKDPNGFTCCQNETLSNENTSLYERVDLILTHDVSHALDATLVGDTTVRTTPPLWPSDHAGVVATIPIHEIKHDQER